MKRRTFISRASTAVAGAGAAAMGTAAAAAKQKPIFVLIHGAWHGAWCWSEVIQRLETKGFTAVAIDLPGHGLSARIPSSYASQDLAAMASEMSPLAALSTNDYRNAVSQVLKGLAEIGTGPVVLVGHSLGGATITAVAEAEPHLIKRLVYVSAFVPVKLPAPINYISQPNFSTSRLGPRLVADPAKVACLRINFRTTDPRKIADNKETFCADIGDAEYPAVANLLTPDEPIRAFATPINPTSARWGKVPRTYIRCTQDHAIPLAGQDQMIAEADQFTAPNKFAQETMATSHSPFLSAPGALVDLLIKAAQS